MNLDSINTALDVVSGVALGVALIVLFGLIGYGVNSRIARTPKPVKQQPVQPIEAELVDDDQEVTA